MDLSHLRDQIDKVDLEIIRLIKERLKLSEAVAEFKSQNNLPVLDKKREDEIVKDRISKFNSKDYHDLEFVSSLFKIILDKSREIQEKRIKSKK